MKSEDSKEHNVYKFLELWQPEKKIFSAKQLVSFSDPLFPLFFFLYEQTRQLCEVLPKRKNEEASFIHPVNVVLDLQKAGVKDTLTFCVGIAHDYVEDAVDFYQRKNSVIPDRNGIRILDSQEKKTFLNLEKSLVEIAKKNNISPLAVQKIISALKLLTQDKRYFYYRYIAGIFACPNDAIKEIALQVKLADRTHNILCIECFSEQERINQCFKNTFLLNNTKHYLLKKYGSNEIYHGKPFPTERLFNKCLKSTYDSYLTILNLCVNKKIGQVKAVIQLAFKKFAFERKGLIRVTEIDRSEIHPLRLFQGIVRKFDTRLHREFEQYEKIKKDEKEYLSRFFSDFRFSSEQLQAVIDYKDAYALKEALARILYQPNYVITRFLYTELTKIGRISKKS